MIKAINAADFWAWGELKYTAKVNPRFISEIKDCSPGKNGTVHTEIVMVTGNQYYVRMSPEAIELTMRNANG